MQEGRIDRARAAYESALRAASASALRNTVQFGEMCFDYAELKARQKDWDMAADYVQRALRIELDAIPGNQVTAATLELAAQVYKKLNRRTEAKDFAARAKQIRSRRDTAMQASTVDVRQLGAMR